MNEAVSFAARCARAHGFSEERVSVVQLVVEEAFVNVCSYAYDNEPGLLEINCITDQSPEGLTLEIWDDGKPFNPLSHAPSHGQTVDIAQRRVGGLGILMLGQMTDNIAYDRLGDSNRVRLTFYKE